MAGFEMGVLFSDEIPQTPAIQDHADAYEILAHIIDQRLENTRHVGQAALLVVKQGKLTIPEELL